MLTAGVYQKLHQLGEALDVHVLSADTRGTAKEQLRDLPLRLHILTGTDHDVQKRDFAKHFDLRQVVAFGNGQNDRLLLKSVKEAGVLAIAVENGEACAIDALTNAHLLAVGAANALDLLLDPKFVIASLRF